MGLISRLTGKSKHHRASSVERPRNNSTESSSTDSGGGGGVERTYSTDSSASYSPNKSMSKRDESTPSKKNGSWRGTISGNDRKYFGRQSSMSALDVETPQGSQLSEVDWEGISRAIVSILATGSLGDTQIDVLESAIAQLLRKATPATICRYLGTTLQESLQPHQKMLSDSQPSDFLHKCHIRWQTYRSIMLPLLEGSFLAVQDSLDRRHDQSILNVHDQCIVAFRNNVLLAENVVSVFQKAVAHQKENVKEPIPSWFIQMVLEIAIIDTRDNRSALFKSSYLAVAESRLQEIHDVKKKQDQEELKKLYALHGLPTTS